jgi:hypothetical protein
MNFNESQSSASELVDGKIMLKNVADILAEQDSFS